MQADNARPAPLPPPACKDVKRPPVGSRLGALLAGVLGVMQEHGTRAPTPHVTPPPNPHPEFYACMSKWVAEKLATSAEAQTGRGGAGGYSALLDPRRGGPTAALLAELPPDDLRQLQVGPGTDGQHQGGTCGVWTRLHSVGRIRAASLFPRRLNKLTLACKR